jgi:hypothetical protein
LLQKVLKGEWKKVSLEEEERDLILLFASKLLLSECEEKYDKL